jgi:hypothetical protein
MPRVATCWPDSGEWSVVPWIAWIATVAMSSLRMVPMPRALPRVAPPTSDRSTWKVSSGSVSPSPMTTTPIVTEVAPSGMVAVPLSAE